MIFRKGKEHKAMIEVKATTVEKDGEKGVQIEAQTVGDGLEIVNETLLIIKALMGNLKKEAPHLHLIAIKAIADHREVLCGDGAEDEERAAKAMSEMMSKGILKN